MTIRELLVRDPFRNITSVVKITDHAAQRVWAEMDEYVPTDEVKDHFRVIADVLAESRQGATELTCGWVSGFFGSGKSHFLKVLGYLLEDRPLTDGDGQTHSSSEFLARNLSLQNRLPLLQTELKIGVIYINLLDYDPQSPHRPTFSRLIYRGLLHNQGLSTEFWVAEWEKDLQRLGKWDGFRAWVAQTFGRSWEEERRLNAESVLAQALPALLPERYGSNEEARAAVGDTKHKFATVEPSSVAASLWEEAKALDPVKGRIVVLLDEVGLYIGDSIDRLADLNALAEQVVQQSEGKVFLIATAQEALTDLVPRLTADRHVLEFLRDRFRLRLGLEPTEVQAVVNNRLLAKTKAGVDRLRQLYCAHQGSLHAALSIDRGWNEDAFIAHYPFPPYAVPLMQSIMGAMRGSVEEARRLSGSERSMLKLSQAILTGEGGIARGADKQLGWLVSLDLFYDALAPDLNIVRSDQVAAIEGLGTLGAVDGLAVASVAKALFLLQQVAGRYPCTLDNLVAALVDRVDKDTNTLRSSIEKCLEKMQENGWVVQEDGQYRLLTPTEHDLEKDVRANWPSIGQLRKGAFDLLDDMLNKYRYEHGRIGRPLKVAIEVDGENLQQEGDLSVRLFTPFADESADDVLAASIAESETLFWRAGDRSGLRPVLERTLAVGQTLEQWRTRTPTEAQKKHRDSLEKEREVAVKTRLPQLIQQAFLCGRLFQGGQETAPDGNDLRAVLNTRLATIAGSLYTEFVDDRPDRDEDCAAILFWQPGTILPDVYTRLGLLTATNQIRQNSGPLHIMKLELRRRKERSLGRSGKDLLEHYEKAPYGYDARLVRLLLATLFKAGVITVRYQDRDLTGPTDPQARLLFGGAREFPKATFDLLPEVDWRKASDLSSRLFGVQGGDTFERAAEIVQRQANAWKYEAEQLSVRCHDNQLPASLGDACQRVGQALANIAQLADPNARLRTLLEHAETLESQMPFLRTLKSFDFAEYRRARSFIDSLEDWGRGLSGDAAERWSRLTDDLGADDLVGRWPQRRHDYNFLLGRYRTDYADTHRTFQKAVEKALETLRGHEAFKHAPDAAEQAIKPLADLRCEVSVVTLSEDSFRCSRCRGSYSGLLVETASQAARLAEAQLDSLLPKPPVEEIEPLDVRRTVQGEGEVDALADELRRYCRRTQRPVEVSLKANPKDGSA